MTDSRTDLEKKTWQIIAISGSPSKGFNSDSMLDAFIRGMEKLPDINVKKVYINDIPMDMYSYENGANPSENEKGFYDLAISIKNTDGLVIATPTYNFSVPAGLKNFIDRIRFVAMDLSKRNTFGQPIGMLGHLSTYFLVSGGTPLWAQKILFFAFPPFWLRAVFLYYGAKCMGARYTGDVKIYTKPEKLKKYERLGTKFAGKVKQGCENRVLERIFWRPPQIDRKAD